MNKNHLIWVIIFIGFLIIVCVTSTYCQKSYASGSQIVINRDTITLGVNTLSITFKDNYEALNWLEKHREELADSASMFIFNDDGENVTLLLPRRNLGEFAYFLKNYEHVKLDTARMFLLDPNIYDYQ
jgi:hypothetical protein